mmetsp:Transcript_12201/g.35323  ORF Transcript_12201/g.35323 Transcript_12201/m.35323 type:complete len:241 (-) Transcript_12201:58-780(-)
MAFLSAKALMASMECLRGSMSCRPPVLCVAVDEMSGVMVEMTKSERDSIRWAMSSYSRMHVALRIVWWINCAVLTVISAFSIESKKSCMWPSALMRAYRDFCRIRCATKNVDTSSVNHLSSRILAKLELSSEGQKVSGGPFCASTISSPMMDEAPSSSSSPKLCSDSTRKASMSCSVSAAKNCCRLLSSNCRLSVRSSTLSMSSAMLPSSSACRRSARVGRSLSSLPASSGPGNIDTDMR